MLKDIDWMGHAIMNNARWLGRHPSAWVLLVTAALSSGIAANQVAASAAPVTEPWPPFVMTYRETANGLGLNGAQGTQRFRLEYTDRRHFRTTLISNAAVPGAVGSTWTFAGTVSTFHDAVHAHDMVNDLAKVPAPNGGQPADGLTVPADWLVPGNAPYLATQPGYSVSPQVGGQSVLVHAGTWSGHTVRQELTFRQADSIPVRNVEMVDGQVRRDVEVEQLQVR